MFGVQGWKSQRASLKRKVPEQSYIRKGSAEPCGWGGEGVISPPLKEGEKGLWIEQEQGAPARVLVTAWKSPTGRVVEPQGSPSYLLQPSLYRLSALSLLPCLSLMVVTGLYQLA